MLLVGTAVEVTVAISLYLLLALVVVVAVGLWWFQQRRKEQPAKAETHASNYHGVMIVAGPHACGAVSELSGRRMLARQAPLLPLSACDSERCQCTYRHLNDRRQSIARRHINVDIDKQHKGYEKRSTPERRRHSLK